VEAGASVPFDLKYSRAFAFAWATTSAFMGPPA
jgi:hypothetical protein